MNSTYPGKGEALPRPLGTFFGRSIGVYHLAGYTLHVHEFKTQWRKPRSKSRRIQKKWAKDARNWRQDIDRCYMMGRNIICSEDVYWKLKDKLNTFDPPMERRSGDFPRKNTP